MAKTELNRLALLGCVSVAVLGLGACSSGMRLGAGTTLGSAVAASSGSDTGAGVGSGSSGTGGTTGTGTTTTGSGSSGAGGGGSGGGSSGGGGGGGGGGGSNPGGNTGSGSGSGALARVGDAAGDLTGGLLAVAGNAVLTGPATLGPILTNVGNDLRRDGLGGLPLVGDAVHATTTAVDAGLNPVAKLTLANQTIAGSDSGASAQLVAVSALSNTTTPGQAATVGLLNGGGATQLASLNVGGAQVLGSGASPALLGASVLSPTQAAGTAATVGLLSGAASPLSGVTGALGGATPVLTPVTSLVNTVTSPLGGGTPSLAPVTTLISNVTSTLPGSTPALGGVTTLVGGVVQGLSGGGLPALPTGTLGLAALGGAGGSASVGPVSASGGLLGGLGVVLTGR